MYNLSATPLNYKLLKRRNWALLFIYLALHTVIDMDRHLTYFLNNQTTLVKICTLCSEIFSELSRCLLNLWYLEDSSLYTENIKGHRVILWCYSVWSKTNKSWQTANVFSTKPIRALWDLCLWVCVWFLENHQICLALALCFMAWVLLWKDFQDLSMELATNDYIGSRELPSGWQIRWSLISLHPYWFNPYRF